MGLVQCEGLGGKAMIGIFFADLRRSHPWFSIWLAPDSSNYSLILSVERESALLHSFGTPEHQVRLFVRGARFLRMTDPNSCTSSEPG